VSEYLNDSSDTEPLFKHLRDKESFEIREIYTNWVTEVNSLSAAKTIIGWYGLILPKKFVIVKVVSTEYELIS